MVSTSTTRTLGAVGLACCRSRQLCSTTRTWDHPGVPAGVPLGSSHLHDAVARMRHSRRPAVTSLIPSPDVGPRLLVLVPLLSWQGVLHGVVGGEIHPSGRGLKHIAALVGETPIGHLDLVDEDGHLLYSANGHRGASGSPVVASAPLAFASWKVLSHRVDGDLAPAERLGARLLWLGPLLMQVAEVPLFRGESTGPAPGRRPGSGR